MNQGQTTDEDYLISGAVDDFARADEDALENPNADEAEVEELVNAQTIAEVRQYLKEAIAEQDSVDQIDLTEGAKMTPTQQIAVHKLVKQHLINIQTIIINKVKDN